MIKNSKIAVVIPLYNEEETLHDLFYKIDGVYKILKDNYFVKFIFVNDGSTDDTLAKLEQKYGKSNFVDILNREINSGYGSGLRTGFKKAVDDGFQYIITIDADTNYDQFLIPYFVYEFNPSTEDIMIASPWHPKCSKGNFPLVRYILSFSMTKMYQIALKDYCQPLTCYSACFRLYKKDAIENIKFESNDFLTNTEIITKALLSGFRVKEMPINVNYRLFGISKMKKFHHIKKHFKYIIYLYKNKKNMCKGKK